MKPTSNKQRSSSSNNRESSSKAFKFGKKPSTKKCESDDQSSDIGIQYSLPSGSMTVRSEDMETAKEAGENDHREEKKFKVMRSMSSQIQVSSE